MKRPFREHHLLSILKAFEAHSTPLDLFLRNYFKNHSAVGSKDRKFICETIYGMMRWRSLLDFLSPTPCWENRIKYYSNFSPDHYIGQPSIPTHIQVSFPKVFFEFLVKALGEKRAFEFCLNSNAPAPTTIRTNFLKIQREALALLLEKHSPLHFCESASSGIQIDKKINLLSLPEFKTGYFEIQDEASQLIADLVSVKPGEHCLDFCAGSGGKSLAIAPKMQGRGQIYLHDIRPWVLVEAKKRLKRAGIQNAQVHSSDSFQSKILKGKMDWVLVDAPCSGTGTLRRNPDMKWKFDPAMIERIAKEQREIFSQAIEYLKPKGYIVYATCSILPQENEDQANYFLERFSLRQVAPYFFSFPMPGKMDGFFGGIFQKL